jgi:translation initiation factor IF-2
MSLEPAAADKDDSAEKKKRKRIKKDTQRVSVEKPPRTADLEVIKDKKKKKKRKGYRFEISEEDVDKQIKDTFARIGTKGRTKGAKYRREKRDIVSQRLQQEEEKKSEKNIRA